MLRGAGNAREALWLAIIGNLANVALLPLLVQGMIGLPPLGVAGAALSTVFAQAIAVTAGTGMLLSGRARVALLWRRVRPDWAVIRTMVTIGIPSAVQAVLRSSSRVAMIAIVAPFGTAAIAGYGVATRLTVMLLTPGFGMGNAAGTLVGQNLGAQKPQRAERSAWTIAWINLAFMLVAMALMALKAPEAVQWFNCTEDVAGVAVRAIRVVAIAYAFGAVGVVMGRALDGAGNTVPAMMVNLTTLWGVQVPVGLVLSRFTPLALDGVWVGWALASAANAVAMAYWFRRGGWKRKKV
ncbi:MAG: MATE family efflux transporter [Anaerolineae bacterium]|nr:MATE family efflux transporter [Anaerolineae bacterium]